MNVLELVGIVHELNAMLDTQTALIEGIIDRLSALEECDKVNRNEDHEVVEGNRKLKEASDGIPF